MKLYYLKEPALDRLKSNIKGLKDYYKKKQPWLDDYFESDNYQVPSRIHINGLKLDKSGSADSDLENTKRVYTALKDLTISQATDERLWAYLTHTIFWEYMKKRWGHNTSIRSRYFFHSNPDRALVRNGIARLWWFGHISYDESYNNPFRLTKILLATQDVAHNLTERSFSRNPIITKTILSFLSELDDVERKKYLKRNNFRKLMKHINFLGGVTVLDALSKEDIEEVIIEKLIELEG